LTNIGYGAVSVGESLTNLTISYGLTSIGAGMFIGCPDLPYVTIPASVTNIGEQAFLGCDSLTQAYFMGDAPAVDRTAFQNSRPIGPNGGSSNFYVTTAYYLPGTTGWDDFSSNSMIPAVLWNPVIAANGANFGVQGGQYGFDIIATTNLPIAIEACDDLAQSNWVVLKRLTLTNGLFHFSEPFQTNSPERFYRIGFQ
jgi:hypothetical protein